MNGKFTVVRERSPAPENLEFGHFTLLFCRDDKGIKIYNARAERLFLLIEAIVLRRFRCCYRRSILGRRATSLEEPWATFRLDERTPCLLLVALLWAPCLGTGTSSRGSTRAPCPSTGTNLNRFSSALVVFTFSQAVEAPTSNLSPISR